MEQARQLTQPGAVGGVGERECVEIGGRRTPLRVRRIIDSARGLVNDRLERFELLKDVATEVGGVLQSPTAMQPTPDRGPLLTLPLQRQAVTIEQGAHALVVRVDPLRTGLDVLTFGERRSHGARPPAESRTGFDQRDVMTREQEFARCGETSHPGPDDNNFHDGTGSVARLSHRRASTRSARTSHQTFAAPSRRIPTPSESRRTAPPRLRPRTVSWCSWRCR